MKNNRIIKETLELVKTQEQQPCYHPYLLIKRKTGEKVCASCGRTVYSGTKLR